MKLSPSLEVSSSSSSQELSAEPERWPRSQSGRIWKALVPIGVRTPALSNRNELPQRLQATNSLQSYSTMYYIIMSLVYCLSSPWNERFWSWN